MKKIRMPVGIEDFSEIITQNFYFVDKTSMIRELLENWGKVNLFTRPRRFGKSINMSMLKCFFEIGTDTNLFDGLEISKDAYIIEVKYAKEERNLTAEAEDALGQIDRKLYDQYFSSRKPGNVRHYGIAFCEKICKVLIK